MGKFYKILTIFFLIISQAVIAKNNDFASAVNKLTDNYLKNSSVGIVVESCDGHVYYSKNKDKLLTPASNTKLFTCTTSAKNLGKDFKFTTAFKLYNSLINNNDLNGDLYIVFTGDPSYTTADLKQNLKKLKNLGISWLKGNIIIDNTAFAEPVYASGISYQDAEYSFCAPSTAIVLDGNILKLNIQGGAKPGDSTTILNNSQTKLFKIKNNVISIENSTGADFSNITATIDSDNNIELTGSIVANHKDTIEIPIKNSFKYFSDSLRLELRKNGISFDKRIFTGKAPSNLNLVVVNTSKSLPDLIKQTLKESDNLYADCLLKNIGMQNSGVGTFQDGLNILKGNIESLTGIASNQYKLCDGSGLSRYNLISAEQVATLLLNIYNNEDISQAIFTSLPVSGVDGTLKNRMEFFPLKGNVRAKTGSMSGVSALSGFICFKDGRPIIFSVLINGFIKQDSKNPAKEFEDLFCKLLYEHFNNYKDRM